MKDEKDNKVKTVVIVAMAILVLMAMLPVMVSAQGDIRINEIMYNPSTEQGSDANMEWIELYNNDAEAVNISDWTVDNNSISDNVMEPGDYVVLARNKTAFDAYYGALPCPVIDVTFVLANSGDTIVLCNSTGAEVDNVTYNSSWGADGNGKTLERNATGGWAESLADGGTPCKLNSVTVVVPYSPWVPPMIYICNITVDAMTPENVGKTATVGLFTSAEMIGNEAYYIVNISTPTDNTKMYVSTDAETEDNLMRRTVTEAAPGREISNLTFDPAFVMRDFPLWVGKTWTSTSNVTGIIVNKTGAVIPINTTAVVAGKVTLDVVTVPLGTFRCLVLENNISYEVAGVPISNARKYWMSTQNNELLSPKSQTYRNGNLVDEFELIEAISPTYLNATDNNTTINATTGEFLVVSFETSNPGSTGYMWEVAELDEQVLRQVGDVVFVPDYVPEPGFVGGPPGKQIATFEVVGAGNATINMVYRSPGGTVEDTFTVNVTAS
ncbi:MAG: lamin tail domain-containing protein [Euryarchaeota archaeon]|nr:lamin tail domain-containing protein [Euryarchaeota archaeon]